MSEAKEADFHFVMGARQTVVSLFLAVTLTGLFSTLAYIAGRTMTTANPQGTVRAALSEAVPSSVAAEEIVPEAPPPSVPEPATPASYFQQPELGQTFLQVAATDPGVAAVFAERLASLDFSCLIADGPDERSYRVLVGPLQDNREIVTTRAALEIAGFQPFVRRYR